MHRTFLFFIIPTLLSLNSCKQASETPYRVSDFFSESGSSIFTDLNIGFGDEEIAVENDVSGSFVQVDDMRFRVPEKRSGSDKSEPRGFVGRIWPNGTMGYRLSPEVRSDPKKVSTFMVACNQIMKKTGIGCLDIDSANGTDKRNFVYVVNDKANYSYVGFQGGMQLLGIFNWDYPVIVSHELKHAIGWTHEQSRSDRDKYVIVRSENIIKDKIHNFTKIGTTTNKTAYSFESIMHYGPFAFTSNGKRTLDAKPGYEDEGKKMGNITYIPSSDIKDIVATYGDDPANWCGFYRLRKNIPSGCFWECYWTGDDFANARPKLCGKCEQQNDKCKR